MFVCYGNTGRSVMAQAIFNSMVTNHPDPRIKVLRADSAGVSANSGEGPEELAEVVMRNRGIVISGHQAEHVTPEMLEEFDLVLTMEETHKMRILEMNELTKTELTKHVFTLTGYVGESGNIEDCAGHEQGFYEVCADRLTALIEGLIRKIDTEIHE